MMPKNGSYARAEQLATLEEFIHNLKTDKRIPDWIESVNSYKKLSKIQKANLNEISKIYGNASKIPKKLSIELAKTTALAQDSWANARRKNQPEDLIPLLKKIIDLKRSYDGSRRLTAANDLITPQCNSISLIQTIAVTTFPQPSFIYLSEL